MRRPTLPLLASTAAVVGTMAVAVPALAASGSSSSAAHAARARRCNAVIVISHGRRVRACLIQGPRGYTGFTGRKGRTGKTGATGATGKTGADREKRARTAPMEQPGATGPRLRGESTPSRRRSPCQSSNITSVTEPQRRRLLHHTRQPRINPAADTAVVSPEVSYSTPEAPGLVAVNAQHNNCPATTFEVDTYSPSTLTLATGYAFTIAIP